MPKQIPDEQILEAAVKVIVEQGFHAATTRQIAAAAGINEVTLFRRFGTKAELLREALHRRVQAFTGGGSLEPTGDVAMDLERVVRAYGELVGRMGRLIPTILSEAARNPEVRALLVEPQRMISGVGELLAHHQEAGTLVREPPLQAVAALLGPVMVHAIMASVGAGPGELPRPAEHVRRYLAGRRT